MQYALQNLMESHDTDRLASMIVNAGRRPYSQPARFDYDTGVSPRFVPDYDVRKPNELQRRVQRLVALLQMTYVGPPMIYYGTEAGMWGADDPDGRKPMVWADLHYDDEVAHPSGRLRHRDPVVPDTAVRNIYRELISLRMQHLRLFVDGSFSWLLTDDTHGLLAYERTLGDQRAIIAFNNSDSSQDIALVADGSYRLAYPKGGSAGIAGGKLMASLPPRSARVWVRE